VHPRFRAKATRVIEIKVDNRGFTASGQEEISQKWPNTELIKKHERQRKLEVIIEVRF
jgi:hypothetical protein